MQIFNSSSSFLPILWSKKTVIFLNVYKLCINMKPLAIAQQILMWLCVLPFHSDTSSRVKVFSITFTIVAVVSQVCAFAATVAFSLKFMSIDLEQSLFANSLGVTFLSMIYIVVVLLFLRSKIPGIFEELSQIYTESKNVWRVQKDCKINRQKFD